MGNSRNGIPASAGQCTRRILGSRRAVVSLVAILGLVWIGLTGPHDVSLAIATVAVGLAGANAHQKKGVESPKESVE